jgi:hypothetical protein
VFKFGLVGLNKECFSTDEKYQEIFNFGSLISFYNIEEFTIAHFGVQSARILFANDQSKSTTYENLPKADQGESGQNLLSNLSSKFQKIRFKKTEASIYSLSDLHQIASNTIKILYSIQTKNKQLFIALVILSGIGIFLIAFAEYDYRITRVNICSKVCYLILLGLVTLGVIVTSILILISQVVISRTLKNIKSESCFDLDLISQIEGDLTLNELLIPISIGMGLMIIVGILGISLSCHFWAKRWNYRLWKPKGGRFM